MSTSPLARHADELRGRLETLAADAVTLEHAGRFAALAHRTRGSALLLGLDGLAVALAAAEAAAVADDPDGAVRAIAHGRVQSARSPSPTTSFTSPVRSRTRSGR
ncbi:MAG: hypothetical protein EXQ77_05000 [Thermoleophilia bacterium]|nr:hypothetical protein [Thermoleophilia bacterium]